jgi:putative membrane protein
MGLLGDKRYSGLQADGQDLRSSGTHLAGVSHNGLSLANERTYLAWARTALALIGGGVAVLQLLADSIFGFVAAYVLVGLGALVAVAGLLLLID